MLPIQINLAIQGGVDFTQEFTVTNNDMSPKNITGATFYAQLAKHQTAQIVEQSTTSARVYSTVSFTTTVIDGVGGRYSISLTPDASRAINPGKYVYSIVMKDTVGDLSELVNGLVFVNKAFGFEPVS